MVTHNPEIAEHADRIIVLRDGQIVERINLREVEKGCSRE
jgi:ABC-type lipoprotein export system ATPase subunit